MDEKIGKKEIMLVAWDYSRQYRMKFKDALKKAWRDSRKNNDFDFLSSLKSVIKRKRMQGQQEFKMVKRNLCQGWDATSKVSITEIEVKEVTGIWWEPYQWVMNAV